MPALLDSHKGLADRLPPRVREALTAGNACALATILNELTEQERQTVREVIRALALLPQQVAPLTSSPDIPDYRDSLDIEWQAVEGMPTSIPLQFFSMVNGELAEPPLEWVDAGHRAAAVVPSGSVLFPVWFATTRRKKQEGHTERGFAGYRDEEKRVHYGVARVFVPESHEAGSVGTHWLKRWLWTWQDDRLLLRNIEGRDEPQFWAELQRHLKGDSAPGNQVLLFVHGYNVSFADAVVRAAQLGYDLAFRGITACFSWPSRGTYRGYMIDEAACETSVPALTAFLAKITGLVGVGRVHILSHSMGNRVVLRAIQELMWEMHSDRDRQKLGHIMLAAPDVDRDLFQLLAPICPKASALQTNVYVSRKDRAVALARWLHGYDRAGFHPPVTTVSGAATIDVTHVDISGHGAFCQSRDVLRDLWQILEHNAMPGEAQRRLLPAGGGNYWELG